MWLFWSACTLHSPFEGPGFEGGEFVSEHPGPFVVAVTHARPARGQGSAFAAHVDAIEAELAEAPGLVGYSLRGELGGRDNWTLSVWESEDAMVAFMVGEAHAAAMADASTVLEEIHTEWWEESDPATMPPAWGDALEALP